MKKKYVVRDEATGYHLCKGTNFDCRTYRLLNFVELIANSFDTKEEAEAAIFEQNDSSRVPCVIEVYIG